MNKNVSGRCWAVLAGVILIRGFAGGGINTVSGLFLLPASEEIGSGIGEMSVYFSVISLVMVFWLPIAGRLFERMDVRFITAAGATLMALSFALMGIQYHVAGWYFLAVPYAMGSAILVTLLGPVLIQRWFSRNTGFLIGLQMAVVGFFGAVFQPLTSRWIESFGWRKTYLYLGMGIFAVILLLSFLLRDKDRERVFRESGRNSSDGAPAVTGASFYYLLLFMISITGVSVFTQHLPVYGSLQGFSLTETGGALAFSSLGNGAGSMMIGFACDRFGAVKTCYAVLAVGILTVSGFALAPVNLPLFAVLAFFFGIVTSAVMVLSPILTLDFFGRENYEKFYARVSMGAPIASILLLPAYGFVYDMTGGYGPVFAAMAVLLAAAAVCICLGWRKR